MVSGIVSVPSVNGPRVFTVTGTHTLAYAQRFANFLNSALTAGTLGYENLSTPGTSIPGFTPSAHPTVTEDEISSPGTYTLPPESSPGATYTFADPEGAADLKGSGTGDDVLVAGVNDAVRYFDNGGNNTVTFVNGNNTYYGDTASSAGSNTIVAGSGFDTIYTGAGDALVYSGTGDALIDMRDTKAAGATSDPTSINPADYNQTVVLDDGANTVYMTGVADVVIASAIPDSITGQGQLIFGGLAGDTDLVALVPPGIDTTAAGATVPSIGDDTVIAGSGFMSVYDASDNNIIWGQSGKLVVNFADSVEGSVVAGAGTTIVYGSADDTINYVTTAKSGTAIFVAGTGSGESVNASGSAGSLTMVLGTGNETLTGGSGPTTFNANYDSATGLTGTITIHDFSGADVFDFVGYSASEYQTALASGTATASGYEITLSDNTKVIFAGVTSITGHTSNT